MSVLVLACAAFFAQHAPAAPTFEVASVKPAAPRTNERFSSAIGGDPGRIDYRNVSIKMMIMQAYSVEDYQVDGPGWLATTGYDVVATYPVGTPKDQVNHMLQALLGERFHLAFHREPREQSVYALVVAQNGPKLTESRSEDSFYTMRGGHLEAKRYTIAGLVSALALAVDRPIVDHTGLSGVYDITLDFEFDRSLARVPVRPGGGAGQAAATRTGGGSSDSSGPAGPTIFSALQDQLGLKLERRKAPLDTLVVDHADRTPLEN